MQTNFFSASVGSKTPMNGLRVYTPSASAVSDSAKTFYSRRGSGPIYCWRYDDTLAAWRPSRVHTVDLTLHTLNNANWKSLPVDLKSRLGEHYLE